MKTGVIVCLVENEDKVRDMELGDVARSVDISADKMELVTSGEGDAGLIDAWWRLTAKGMYQIICVIAEMTASSGPRLTGRQLII